MSILECCGITKRYGKTTALDHIDLSLDEGHIVGLLGPNGSGKTTLIKLICRLLQASEGEIRIDGTSPGVHSKSIISYLPDHESLPEGMTLKQLIRYYQDFFSDFDRDRAYQMLSTLSLPENARLSKLSKGNREKVQLILTMSRRARIYILDEPIGGVDPAARDYILSTILSSGLENSLVVISTHLIADVESILDEVVFLKEGKIILHENADDLRQEHHCSVDDYFREVFAC